MEIFLRYIFALPIALLFLIWIYLFIYSFRYGTHKPWGFIVILVGVFVAGHDFYYRYGGYVVLSVNSLFVIVVISVLFNLGNIQEFIFAYREKLLFFNVLGLSSGLLIGFLLSILIIKLYPVLSEASYTPLSMIFYSIQVSLAEEILFRGFFLNYLKQFKFHPFLAVFLQAIIFTLLHAPRYLFNWIPILLVFAMGIFAGLITWKSNSLIPAFCMHVAANLLSSFLLYNLLVQTW